MTSMEEMCKSDEDLSETHTKIHNLYKWLKNDVGISQKLLEIHPDGGEEFIKRIYEFRRGNFLKTKKFLHKFYKFRCRDGVDEIFQNRCSVGDDILKSCQTVYLCPVPQLTETHQRIIVMKIAPNMSAAEFEPQALFKRFFMISDIRFAEETSVKEDVFIFDMENFTKQHAIKLIDGGYKNRFLKCLKDIYPRRTHSIHVIKAKPWQRSSAWIWLKISGVSNEMTRKIKFYSDAEDLEVMAGLRDYSHQSNDRLHEMNYAWTKKLISNKGWFESQEEEYLSICPKPVKLPSVRNCTQDEEDLKISTHSEVYTFKFLEGSFRKLGMDQE